MSAPSDDLLWKRYEHDVNLHRGYLDLVLKLNIFYYAVTGAIISFYFLHSSEPLIKYSLVLPFIMSVALAVFFWRAASAADISDKYIMDVAEKLGFDVYSAVAKVLSFLLRIFFCLMVISSAGIAILFLKDYIL